MLHNSVSCSKISLLVAKSSNQQMLDEAVITYFF